MWCLGLRKDSTPLLKESLLTGQITHSAFLGLPYCHFWSYFPFKTFCANSANQCETQCANIFIQFLWRSLTSQCTRFAQLFVPDSRKFQLAICIYLFFILFYSLIYCSLGCQISRKLMALDLDYLTKYFL